MNGNNYTEVWDDLLLETLKEANPAKATEIKKRAKALGYDSVLDYLISADTLYASLVKETEKGKVLGVLIKDRATLERLLSTMGKDDVLLNMKVKGLEFKHNGHKEYVGK